MPTETLATAKAEKREIDLGKFRFPALRVTTAIEEKGERVESAGAKLAKTVESLQPRLIAAMDGMDAHIKPRQASLAELEVEVKDAFKSEIPAFEAQREKLTTELRKLREERATKELAITGKYLNAVEKSKSRFETERKYLGSVLTFFPDAQHIDLSCMHTILSNKGLPAVALFNPDDELARFKADSFGPVEVNTVGRWEQDYSSWLNRRTRCLLTARICSATGVLLRRHWDDADYAEVRGAINCLDGRTEAPTAIQITLTAKFSEGGRTIPREARKEIRRARESKLFDEVLLLAEVREWAIRYHDLGRGPKPILEGQVVRSSKNRDPLIIGFKKLEDGRRIALVVGKFDVTPIEELIHAEFATKP